MKKRVYTNKNIISSLIWKLLQSSGAFITLFILQIVMARLLAPETFGLIAIVMVIISLANIFIDSGLNSALIQKKDADELDYSSVFTSTLSISILLYILLYIFAPSFADFYNQMELIKLVRVLGIMLITGAFTSVQNAYIAKNALFKVQFKISFITSITSGILGIICAYLGFGVWALVIQQVIDRFITTIFYLFLIDWKPRLNISINRMKRLFSFSYKILFVSLVNELYNNIQTLLFGYFYEPSTLGYYNRGSIIPKSLFNPINSSIKSIMFPVFSNFQDSTDKVRSIAKRSLKTSFLIVFPMMIGLMIVAKPLVLILLTSKWLPAVYYMQIFALIYAIEPIHSINRQIILGLGKSNISLVIEIVRKILGLSILIISIRFGPHAIALGALIDCILGVAVSTYPVNKLIDYPLKNQIIDIAKPIIVTVIMAIIIYPIGMINLSSIIKLLIQSFLGFITYFTILKLIKYEPMEYLISTLKTFKNT